MWGQELVQITHLVKHIAYQSGKQFLAGYAEQFLVVFPKVSHK